MEVEFKTPPKENGTEKEETTELVVEEIKNAQTKLRSKGRSRSGTPQKLKITKNDKNEFTSSVKSVHIIEESNGSEGDISKNKIQQSDEGAEKIDTQGGGDSTENKVEKQNPENVDCEQSTLSKNRIEKIEQAMLNENGGENGTDKEESLEIFKEQKKPEGEGIDMDPLVLATDEPDPELQFDDNSDIESSGKGSPVLQRCKTRRSQTRNIPTPKTPKSIDSDSEKNSVAPTPDPVDTDSEAKPENLNDTNDSIDIGNISTQAEVGSDVTRMSYIEHHSSLVEEDRSFLNASRERSLAETLRNLSSRRSIRPIGDDYRKQALKNNQHRTDQQSTSHFYQKVIPGNKRKDRSVTPEDTKRFKLDTSSIGSLFSSPISNIKNKFKSDLTSSTPKLTGYKDSSKDIHADKNMEIQNGDTENKKSWCSVM